MWFLFASEDMSSLSPMTGVSLRLSYHAETNKTMGRSHNLTSQIVYINRSEHWKIGHVRYLQREMTLGSTVELLAFSLIIFIYTDI